jgi:branched-chain amino acid transport system substrate-binding protein
MTEKKLFKFGRHKPHQEGEYGGHTMNLKAFLALLLVCAIAVACTTTQTTTQTTQEQTPVRIGLSAPLTGEAASFGEGTVAGAELAAKEINEAGGINGRKIQLVYEDDKCTSESVNAFHKLLAEGVDVIIGPVCSSAAGPALPIAQEAKTPVIITTASAPKLVQTGDYIFRIYPSDAFQGKFQAEYVYNTLGKKKVAFIYTQNDWGQGLHDVFVVRFKELGGTVVLDEGIGPAQSDLRTTVAKVQQAQPEAIVADLFPVSEVAFLKQAREAKISVPILGGDAEDADEVVKSGQAEGLRYTVVKVNLPEELKAKAEAASGKKTQLPTPFAYDAIKLYAATANKIGTTDKQKIRDALATADYQGVSNHIQFDENRDLKSAQYDVKVVKNNEATVMS